MTRTRDVLLACLIGATAAAACGDERPRGASPCKPFSKPAEPTLEAVALGPHGVSEPRAVLSTEGRAYVLSASGDVFLLGQAGGRAASLGPDVESAVVTTVDGQVTLAALRLVDRGGARVRELLRLRSGDGGVTFGAPEIEPEGDASAETWRLAAGRGGALHVIHGPWAGIVGEPVLVDADPATDAVWVVTRLDAQRSALYLVQALAPVTGALEPVALFEGAATAPVAGVVVRGSARANAGRFLFRSEAGEMFAVDPFGPSGLPVVTRLVGAPVLGGVLGRDGGGDVVAAGPAELTGLLERGAGGPPPSLLATGCFDPAIPTGRVEGGIDYAVASPLWSDGAAKDRFVVVPDGAPARLTDDGDLCFPVGTVAVKTFSVQGRRIETRLLVQHALDDWVGYSYEWNADGTDATLLAGSKLVDLGDDLRWTFPSSTDCTACHTPAAGYTLGPELRQVASAFDSIAPGARPVPQLASLDGDAPLADRARSYLHTNCSSCHRPGSATGLAQLDLRVDTPLEATGLCGEPKAGTYGEPGARLVLPGNAPASVLVKRMRATDATRMPKLASRVVDERGVSVVESWISGLRSCP